MEQVEVNSSSEWYLLANFQPVVYHWSTLNHFISAQATPKTKLNFSFHINVLPAIIGKMRESIVRGKATKNLKKKFFNFRSKSLKI